MPVFNETVEKDALDNYAVNAGASVVARPTGGSDFAADRNARAWGFAKGSQGFRVVFETDDGSRIVLFDGTGDSEPELFNGVRVDVRVTSNMEKPTQLVVSEMREP